MNDTGSIPPTVDEKDLIRRLQQGQEWAFEVLVGKFQKRLMKLAYAITLDREESLEIVQDVFLSVHRNIRQFKGDSSLAGWLRKITVNMSLNWKRRWKRRFRWHHQPFEPDSGKPLTDVEANRETPESHYADQEMMRIVMQKVDRLPDKLRAVFVLRTIEELSYEEIASTLGIRTGTVSSRMYHARQFLQEAMDSGSGPRQGKHET